MADVPVGEILVSVEDVSKVYIPSPTWLRVLIRSSSKEAVTALDRVNLKVGAGEICAVVGPNGAGKSTLFRILTGLTTPSRGRALVGGLDATRQSSRVRRIVGFMPADDRSLYLRNTCVENLRFHGRLQGMDSGDIERPDRRGPRDGGSELRPRPCRLRPLLGDASPSPVGACPPPPAPGPDPRRADLIGRSGRRLRVGPADQAGGRGGQGRRSHQLAPAGGGRGTP